MIDEGLDRPDGEDLKHGKCDDRITNLGSILSVYVSFQTMNHGWIVQSDPNSLIFATYFTLRTNYISNFHFFFYENAI